MHPEGFKIGIQRGGFMTATKRIIGFALFTAGFALLFAAWPWIMALGVVLAGTFWLILPGEVLLPAVAVFPAALVLGVLRGTGVPCIACVAALLVIAGVLAARQQLLQEWNALFGEELPFLAKRKLYRMCGLFFPLLVFPLWGQGAYRITLGCLAAVILLAEILRKRDPVFERGFIRFFSGVSKAKETEQVSGTAWYLWGAAIASLFPGVVGPSALVMMTLGDAWAVLAGKRWGRRRILGEKTFLGTFACFASSFLAGYAFAMINSQVPVPVITYVAGAGAAAFSELVTPGRWDNLTVAPATAFVIWAAAVFV
jgi:dolichol kinase